MSKGRTARRDRRRSVAGRYELVAPAGRDTLGLVWMGNDLLLRREVMVHEVMAGDRLLPEERAGFHRQVAREARAVSRINHPGVMTLLDVVEEPGRTFVITERADGRTLDRVVDEDGPLHPVDAAAIGRQLLAALEAAHRKGIVHHDVRPATVVVLEDARVKLTGFPIVTPSGVAADPAFVPPEDVGADDGGAEADFWALGATLYYAVEGEPPFGPEGAGDDWATRPPRTIGAGPLTPVIQSLLNGSPEGRSGLHEQLEEIEWEGLSGMIEAEPERPDAAQPGDSLGFLLTPPAAEAPPPPAAAAPAADEEEAPEATPGEPTAPAGPPAVAAHPGTTPEEPEAPAADEATARRAAEPSAGGRSEPRDDDEAGPLDEAHPAAEAGELGRAGPGPRDQPEGHSEGHPEGHEELAQPPAAAVIQAQRDEHAAQEEPGQRASGTVSLVREADPITPAGRTAPATAAGRPAAARPGEEQQGGQGRWPLLMASVLGGAVIALVVVFALLQLNGTDERPVARPPAGTQTASTQSTVPGARMTGVTPEGWQEYLDPQFGWRIAVPGNWEPVQDRAERVAFRDPETGAFARVDRAEDPLKPLTREPERAELTYRRLRYRRIRLAPTTYKGMEAVDWEFGYTAEGTEYHAADLHVLVDDVDYVISFQAPEVVWPSARPNLERIRNSFEVS